MMPDFDDLAIISELELDASESVASSYPRLMRSACLLQAWILQSSVGVD
jgi:hypothetical protein